MKRVLMVAYHYPPSGGAGVPRTVFLARHLPARGWAPVLLTPRHPLNYFTDPGLILPGEVGPARVDTGSLEVLPTLKRGLFWLRDRVAGQAPAPAAGDRTDALMTRTVEGGAFVTFAKQALRNLVVFPDEKNGWFVPAVAAGMRTLASRRVDAIWSTAAPLTAHLVAMVLARTFGIPWVADFRDHPTRNWFADPGKWRARARVDRWLEGLFVRSAAGITAVSEGLVDDFIEDHPEVPPSHFHMIPNAYEPTLYEGSVPQSDRFEILHSGIFYEDLRSPEPVVAALAALIDQGVVDRADLKITFLGPRERHPIKVIERYGLSASLETPGFVPNRVAAERQRAATVLLLITSTDDARSHGITTSKIFEYFAARRPILHLGNPDDSAARLVAKAEAGCNLRHGDRDGIRNTLAEWYRAWKVNRRLDANPDVGFIRRYSAVRMAARLAHILDLATRNSNLPGDKITAA